MEKKARERQEGGTIIYLQAQSKKISQMARMKVFAYRYPDLLSVQVDPSQPSLQTQVKESPLTTQVPPFSHGLGRQLLFLAAKEPRKGQNPLN